MLHVADVIAMMTGIGGGLDGMLYRLEEGALAAIHLKPTDVPALMSRIVQFVEQTIAEARS